MKKKILVLLLTLFAVSAVRISLPDNNMVVQAAELQTEAGNFTYDILEDGTVAITDYTEEARVTEVVIPAEIDGKSVTTIGDWAFSDCSSLSSITLPESVTSIGEGAFYWCSSLSSITIPESVTSIGDLAFSDCSSLSSITIPESVTSIGNFIFYGCESLSSIMIPERVTSIEDGAFEYCESLSSITIPESVTSIGDQAFWGCSSLSSITIPERVTSIGDLAFEDCESLSSITIPESVTSIGGRAFLGTAWLENEREKNSLVIVNGILIDGRTTTGDVTIPERVTSIGGEAFAYCSSLSSITIPERVTSIGDGAFYECSNLSSITIPESVTSIGGEAFAYCSSLSSITIPEGVTSIGDIIFYGCESLSSITIPESVTSIGVRAFSGTAWLENEREKNSLVIVNGILIDGRTTTGDVTIPESVTSIGDGAFYECSNLSSITIPESVTSIGYGAFWRCSSLSSITIPESVTSIGGEAFAYCSSLSSITIPEGVTSIGYDAFEECSNLRDVYYCGTEEQWYKIYIEGENDVLKKATIHFNASMREDSGNNYDDSGNSDSSNDNGTNDSGTNDSSNDDNGTNDSGTNDSSTNDSGINDSSNSNSSNDDGTNDSSNNNGSSNSDSSNDDTSKEVEEELIPNLEYALNTVDGTTISTKAEDVHEATMLVFGRTTCYNTYSTIQDISNSEWIHDDKIKVNFVEVDKATQEETKSFADEYGCEEITFCYSTLETNNNNIMWQYLNLGEITGTNTLPVIVLIDSNNMIRNIMTGKQRSTTLLKMMNAFMNPSAGNDTEGENDNSGNDTIEPPSQEELIALEKKVYQINQKLYNEAPTDQETLNEYLQEEIPEEIKNTAIEITADCETDMEKLQAIHDWIANNIYYDFYNWTRDNIKICKAEEVFKNRGTICEGYSVLTAAMCRAVGIPCKVIKGYALGVGTVGYWTQGIVDSNIVNHAWNEAYVDNRWVILDVTWDSQSKNSVEDITAVFQNCVQEYFDPTLEIFSKTHKLIDEKLSNVDITYNRNIDEGIRLNISIKDSKIIFDWDEVEGAINYEVQFNVIDGEAYGIMYSGNDADTSYEEVARPYFNNGWPIYFRMRIVKSDGTVSYSNRIEYTPPSYKVTFMDGETVVATQTVFVGDSATLPVIKKDGYDLTWEGSYTKIESDVTVNAIWTPKPIVTTGSPTTTQQPSTSIEQGKPTQSTNKQNQSTQTPNISTTSQKDTTYSTQIVKKVKKLSVKNNKSKSITIKWKWQSAADGYQVQIATNKYFTKGKKTKTIRSGYTDSLTWKGLKQGKTYYVRVRAYEDGFFSDIYGSWSSIKKIKIQK